MADQTNKVIMRVLAPIALVVLAACVALEVSRSRSNAPPSPPPATPPAPWWQGTWKNSGGPPHPYLELTQQRGNVAGQFVEAFSEGYLISRAASGAAEQASGDQLLFSIDPKPDPATAGEKPSRIPPPLYLLVRRAEGQRAELFQLKDAPGLPRLVRGDAPAARPIVFPADPELHHTRIASFIRAEGKP